MVVPKTIQVSVGLFVTRVTCVEIDLIIIPPLHFFICYFGGGGKVSVSNGETAEGCCCVLRKVCMQVGDGREVVTNHIQL